MTARPGPAGAGWLARKGAFRLALIAAAYIALLLAVFHRVWWPGKSGVQIFGWDCLRVYWPDLAFQARALGDGELPLWNPYLLGGHPAYGDPQSGLFSPVNWLLWIASWLSGSAGPWLITVKVLLLLFLGLLGMHLLLARRTGSHIAGAAAAVVYVLGGPLLVHKNSSLLWPLLFLPWVVLALDHYLAGPEPRRAVLLAALLWLCGSAGSPNGFFYALLVIVPYWVHRLVADRQRVWRERARHGGGMAIAALTAGLLLAATYVPAAQLLDETPRAERGLAYVLSGSLSWRQTGELLLPNLDANWMTDIYMGPLALAAAVFGLARAGGRARCERLFWAGLALFSIACALGQNGHVLEPLARWVPGFGLFRIAYRYKVITSFCLALLAGHGVADMAGPQQPAWPGRIAAALAATWILFALASRALWPLVLAGSSLVLFALAIVHRARARTYLAAALAFVLADLWVAGSSKIAILQPPPDLARDAALLARLDGADRAWRYFKRDQIGDHAGSVFGRRELSGYVNPFVLRRMADVEARAARSPALLRRFNVRYWLGKKAAGPDFRPIAPGIHEIDDPVPIARVYSRAETLPAERVLARLTDPAPLDAALVEPADVPDLELPAGEGPPTDGRLTLYTRNLVEVEVTVPAPGILVLAEAHSAAWQAEVDGRPAKLFRANYALRAVLVPAGRHRVKFALRPAGLAWLLGAFALGLLLLALAALPARLTRGLVPPAWRRPAR